MKIQMKHPFAVAFAGALVLITQTASAQTWQTVDDYQYVAGQGTFNAGLTVAPSGVIFGSGYGYDASGGSHGLVMGSADGGNTWSAPLDDFTGGPGDNGADYAATTSDPSGNVYAVGEYYDNAGLLPNHWLVRRSTDGGITWSTTDDYQDGGWTTRPFAVASDSAGNIYVAGYSDSGTTENWIVRKGNGGNNFTTVDSGSASGTRAALAVFVHPTAGIFVAGNGPIATSTDKRGRVTTTYGWLVRRSTDGGATWSTVDTLSGADTAASGIGADAVGNIYAVGTQSVTSGTGKHATTSDHWLVRKSPNGGSSWTTVDNYQLSAGASSWATSFAADSYGNLFVAGYSGGTWIVRENPGGTGTWRTVDSGTNAYPASITADRLGHVFVGGTGNDSSGIGHWLVRRQ